jgi:branched-chain amino acid transport system substrate-binding protein
MEAFGANHSPRAALKSIPPFECKRCQYGSRSIRLIGWLTIFILFLAVGSPERVPAKGDPSDSQSDIVLGMSTVLSGANANLGEETQRGVLAGLERVNRKGGINGRKLRLITLDDGLEPARAAPNMRKLIENDHVLAVVSNVGSPTATVEVPLADELKTLLFALYSGAPVLRENPPDRYVINFRAGYAEEIKSMLDALIGIDGLKPEEIAFFTQNDFGLNLAIEFLDPYGLRNPGAVQLLSYERNTLAVEGAVARLLMSKNPPRAVIMLGPYAPTAKFIKLCLEGGLKPLFLSLSFVDADSFAKALGNTDAQVIVTQVVPSPSDDTIPIVREFKADLNAIDSSASPGYVSLEGYIDARILTAALEKIQGSPTRESLVDALEGMHGFDIGLGEPLFLSPTQHQASHRVWPTILKAGKFVPFNWSEIKALVKGEALP